MLLFVATLVLMVSQPATMSVDENISSPPDPIAQRDLERASEARWFIVGASEDSIFLVDRKTLNRRGTIRRGWTMAIRFANGKIIMRATNKERWDCENRTDLTEAIQTYDGNGTPDPMYTPPAKAQPVVPDTAGEYAFNYVCDRDIGVRGMPMPVNRDPVSAGAILAAYADGSEVTILGMLLATLDPFEDEARIKGLLELEKPDKRARLTKLIWNGLR